MGERNLKALIKWTLILLPLVLSRSCELLDPEEKTPSFIHVKDVSVETDSSEEGTDSHDIRYAWVYVDDQLQGVYELPARVYTPKSGERNIKVRAGILKNGRIEEKVPYPFYRIHSEDRELVQDSSIVSTPSFTYYDQQDVKIWHENFDDPNAQEVLARPSSDTTLDLTQDPNETYEGPGSGKITLTPQKDDFLGASDAAFPFQKGGEVYLELDYRTSDTLQVGLLAEYPGKTIKRSLLNLTPTRRRNGSLYWNKIYVQLSPIVGEEPNASSYEVFLQSKLRDNVAEAEILIDNFKVLYQDI